MNVTAMRATGRMLERDYDRERAELSALYGESGTAAAAKREQALAMLFYRSGWTQEKLAEKEGRSEGWVCQTLRFGNFLNFLTTVSNSESLPSNFTERRFRGYWAATSAAEKNERIRFQAVLDLMSEDLMLSKRAGPKGIEKPIKDKFSDGKWHSLDEIVAAVDAPESDVKNALNAIGTRDQSHVRPRLPLIWPAWQASRLAGPI